jgi:hypothetical protein
LDNRPSSITHIIKNEQWEEILRYAFQQNLGALLHKKIKIIQSTASAIQDFPQDVIVSCPPQFLQQLHRQHLRDGANSLARSFALQQILDAFSKKKLPIIVLKGIHLAEVIYNDPTVRPMSDFDLLVRPVDLDSACQVLDQLGYRSRRKFWPEYHMRISHEMPAFSKPNSPSIELHWTLIEPDLHFSIDLDGLWLRARSFEALNFSESPFVLTLSPEDLVLHLCMHAATQHRFRGALRMAYDIALTIQYYQDQLDWNILHERSLQWGSDRAVYLMLQIAHHLLGAPIPVHILQTFQSQPYDPEILDIAMQLLFAQFPIETHIAPNIATLANLESPKSKFAYILKNIFIPTSELSRRYPVLPDSPKVIFFYFVHFIDIIRKHTKSIIRLARNEKQYMDSAKDLDQLQQLEQALLNKVISHPGVDK